jgi:putative toxin-antitoxin system antitoxin component (TIGR02293 family)
LKTDLDNKAAVRLRSEARTLVAAKRKSDHSDAKAGVAKAESAGNVPGQVLEFLGLKSLAASLNSDIEVIDLIERGLHKKCVNSLACRLGLTFSEVAGALHVAERTLRRWMANTSPKQQLTPSQSSQLWLLGVIFAQATYVLGSEGLALEWLRKNQIGLDRRSPLDLASSPIGCYEVMRLLKRIEHGVYV